MITSVNKDNAKYYNALYAKANDELSLEGASKIYDLQSYFSKIQDLAAKDLKYTILPLDEDYFQIDANTRKIIVPQSFRANGIAVKGDQVAEIVYFRIARYFDFMDLNNTEIYIQWKQGNTDNSPSGVSKEWVRDIESDPDYLIFGWPLDSEITASAGPIKFSVRFIQWDEEKEKIVYSFSTLDTTATINPALDFEGSELIVTEEVNNMIKNRIKNTEYKGEGPTPETAVFTVDLDGQTIDLKTNDTIDDDESSYILLVQATSSDAGVINYSWRNYSVADINNITNDDKRKIKESPSLLGSFYYKQISPTSKGEVPEINGGYYIIENGEYVLSDKIKAGEIMPENQEIFEQYGAYKLTQKGQYWAVAENSLGLKHEYTLSTSCVIVPGASEVEYNMASNNNPIMQPNNGFKAILEYNITSTDGDNVEYNWYKDGTLISNSNEIPTQLEIQGDSAYTTDIQGNYQLIVTTNRNGDSVETLIPSQFVSYLPIKPIVTIAAADGEQGFQRGETLIANYTYDIEDYQIGNELSYVWYDSLKTEAIYTAINDNTFTPSNDLAILGHQYYCIVINNYNGQSVSSEQSNYVTCIVDDAK